MIAPGASAAPAWMVALLVGLLAFALRATILLAAAWLVARLLRAASAATRHLVWTSAVAGVLLLPVFGGVLPAWNVPILTLATPASPEAPPDSLPGMAPPRGAPVAVSSVAAGPVASDVRSSERRVDALRWTRLSSVSRSAILVFAWLGGVLLVLSRLAIAIARVAAWRRSSPLVEDERWLALQRRLSRRYGIARPVVLLENDATDVPVTWGIVYPVVLLPPSASRWDIEQCIAVLTHELAHVKRFDALTQLIAQVALALLWFHPLAWVAARRMRQEREHACDDFVLVAGARPSRYADDLLGLARRLTRPGAPAAAALAMARRSELEGRLLAILDPHARRSAMRRAGVAALLVAGVAITTPLAAFRPAVRERPAVVAAPASVVSLPAPLASPADSLGPRDGVALLTGRLGRISMPSAPIFEPGLARLRVDTEGLRRSRVDTEPIAPIDVETLIEVTRAAKRMTADHEKGQLLALIAKRYQRNDVLRDAYLDAVGTFTSDLERARALTGLLDRDTLPASSVTRVLRATTAMSSDLYKGQVLKRVSPAVIVDSTVQRAYLDAILAMTSDYERGGALAAIVRQAPLAVSVQLAVLGMTDPVTSSVEKSNLLLLFLTKQGIADERVRRAFFKSAQSLTSDSDYRRLMTAVMQ